MQKRSPEQISLVAGFELFTVLSHEGLLDVPGRPRSKHRTRRAKNNSIGCAVSATEQQRADELR